MYPPGGADIHVVPGKLADVLEGASRPGHFTGVATVVAKLFNIVQPERAYFGQKDGQQLVVIRQMVRDLDFPVEIVAVPTVREPDGLAMSSRSTYLSPDERSAATVLYRALMRAHELHTEGEQDAEVLRVAMSEVLAAESSSPRPSTCRWQTLRRWRSWSWSGPRRWCRWRCESGGPGSSTTSCLRSPGRGWRLLLRVEGRGEEWPGG